MGVAIEQLPPVDAEHAGVTSAAPAVSDAVRAAVVARLPWVMLAVVVCLSLAVGGLVPQAKLGHARSQLSRTRRELASTKAALATRTKERDAAKTELSSAKSNLNDAQQSLNFQGSQLGTLKACLGAIRDFGIAYDSGDAAGQEAARKTLITACREADRLL
ncbi:MAG: hypothetical protein JO367_09430 [Actinobacteria bacterium]|nr:hypothetical protein [Actinomycetota bacterium]MBV9253662.1 hypothetical protein [Actinomycetota bacterium]MBV9934511.1 hypothetical protein [Actinomycetota bacterium]